MRTLRAAPLTHAAFARSGSVIEAGSDAVTANQGRARRFDLALDLAPTDQRAARLASALYSIEASSLPYAVRVIERHPLSPQFFFPGRAGRFLVCVFDSRDDGEPDLERGYAFIGNPAQGIVYRAGVWHGPLDCEERALATPICVAE